MIFENEFETDLNRKPLFTHDIQSQTAMGNAIIQQSSDVTSNTESKISTSSQHTASAIHQINPTETKMSSSGSGLFDLHDIDWSALSQNPPQISFDISERMDPMYPVHKIDWESLSMNPYPIDDHIPYLPR